ncbi:cupin domain-containing protein [Pseudonocardia sp. NPDC049635]|uniref:cupin domain-containing protein n=1 Tax=Pseudonocardia sp. NPDC049635 TaxID=3155506 RepID=UPI0033EC003E
MTTKRFVAAGHSDLDELYADFAAHDLQPLWEMKGLLTAAPAPRMVPFRWRTGDLMKLGQRAMELVPIDRGGDRRVLAFANPGLSGAPYATNSLWAAAQFLGPHEVAPAHRHSPAALRFVLEGSGVWTLVNGDPLHMGRGDLVLTPSMCFHQHHNPSPRSMVWLDVLDLPMIDFLDAIFFEEGPLDEVDQRTDPVSGSEINYAHPGIVPVGLYDPATPHSPLLVYRWADTDTALEAILGATGESAATVRFKDPTRAADVMPTMRCEMLRVRPRGELPPERQTGSRVVAVLAGGGTATVADQEYDLRAGDVYVIPSWATHAVAASDGQLDLFVTSDAPVLEALHVHRTEPAR